MVADANQYLSNSKETNFVHGIRRTMKAAFPLIICVGCLTIFQNNSLENLAQIQEFHGIPTQSSSYGDDLFKATNAVDGKFEEDGEKTSCSFTVGGKQNTWAWWKLPLTKLCFVEYLLIYFRSGTVNRHVGFSVYVFNDSSFVPPSNGSGYTVFSQNTTTCPLRVMNITVNSLTKGIALYNAKEPPVKTSCPGYVTFATIEVCEVQVFGCCNKEYKDVCQPCDPKCFNNLCDSHNGLCIYGCSNAHKKAPNITNCNIDCCGNGCDQTCGNCTNGTHCDRSSGKCPEGCEKHWNGLNCNRFYSIIANAILAFLLAVAIALIVFQRRRMSAILYNGQMLDQHHMYMYQGENRLDNHDNLGGLEEIYENTC